MDWSKAKTYLIIAFTLTNIFLSWSIFADKKALYSNDFFVKESLHNLNLVLQKKDINLETSLPKKLPKMGLLKVQYEEIKEENYPSLFLDFGDHIEILSGKQIRLSIPRFLEFFDTAHAQTDAQAFIHHYGLDNDFVLRNTIETEEQIHLIYDLEYDGMFLEGSYMNLTYDKLGHLHLERTKLEVLEKSAKKKPIKTSVEAVLQASAEITPGESIEAIDLGYYYEEYGVNSLSTTKTATALPHWRIRTSTDTFHYISAID